MRFIKFFVISLCFLLTSCSSTVIKDTTEDSVDNNDNKDDNNNSNVESEEPSLCSDLSKDEVIKGEKRDDISCIFSFVLNETKEEIPSVDSKFYEASFGVNDDNNITFAYIKCFDVREALVKSIYEKSLKENGFLISSAYSLGYKEVSKTTDLYIQYGLIEEEDQKHFDLLVYEVVSRVETFPKDTIKYYLGVDVSPLEAESYGITQDFVGTNYSIRLLINCYNTNQQNFNSYLDLLREENYILEESNDLYYATSNDLLTKIVLYMYDDKTVQMSISSSYPYSYELAILGFSLPKFTNKYSSISYSFVYDKNDNEILAIYYEGIKSDDLYEYGALLEEVGFANSNLETSEGQYTITTSEYIYNKDNSEHKVSLMYCLELNEICVAILY